MATVTKVLPYGNSLAVVFSDGSRLLANPSNGYWTVPTNANDLTKIRELGDRLILTFGSTIVSALPGINMWHVGPNDEPMRFLWPFSLASANIYNGQPDDGFMTPGRPTHNGMDFGYGGAAGFGNPIGSAAAGTVIQSGNQNDGYGNKVTVYHGTWPGYGDLSTYYAHMEDGTIIGNGVNVSLGQTLGLEGSTGNSTGPHLHFVTMVNGIPVDPLSFMAVVNPSNGYVRP